LRAAIGDFVRRPPASAITSPCRSSEPAGPTAATSEKLAQGKLTEGSSVPFSIVDASQFFEFAGRIAEDAADGDTVRPAAGAVPAHGRRRRRHRGRRAIGGSSSRLGTTRNWSPAASWRGRGRRETGRSCA
jgi:hypothetical protein